MLARKYFRGYRKSGLITGFHRYVDREQSAYRLSAANVTDDDAGHGRDFSALSYYGVTINIVHGVLLRIGKLVGKQIQDRNTAFRQTPACAVPSQDFRHCQADVHLGAQR